MNPKKRWLEILLIFVLFFLEGAYLVPDVNEAHYLGKAARFWNESYAPGDFLLSTPDAHGVFVWTFGWLTTLLPLPACAWTGRIVCWFAMAFFWQRLSWNVAPRQWFAVLSAGTFVCLQSYCQMAGEWVFGGMEAKTISYVFIFWGLERITAQKWGQAWIVLGIASMFHVLAGGWTVLAAMISYALCLITKQIAFRWKDVLTLPVGGLLSLPGLIPSLLLNHGAEPEIVKTAERLYVYNRLPHHLLFQAFPYNLILRFIILCVVCIVTILILLWISRYEKKQESEQGDESKQLRTARAFLCFYALTAMGIASIGAVLSYWSKSNPDFYASLLRFYWFRLSDVAVPLAFSLLACLLLFYTKRYRLTSCFVILLILISFCGVTDVYNNIVRLARRDPPRQCAMARINYSQWIDVCKWINKNTPQDAVFIVPKKTRTFTWYSHRGTVANWKDVPQDAAGLIEWRNRIYYLYTYKVPSSQNRYIWDDCLARRTPQKLKQLGEKYGADYMVAPNSRRTDALPVVYRNRKFTVYKLSDIDSQEISSE
ncbi:MAG: hypothetical protein IJQ39_09120 [Thermoguttaceae bacterium]|nr:hypothetical protein [Thermoguttaceae bacterium]